MKTRIILIALLLLSSCNLIDLDNRNYIDPVLQPYVDSFIHEAEIRGHHLKKIDNITVVFGELSPEHGGKAFLGSRKIVINPKSVDWKHFPETVVFHELGHLILKRDHLEGRTVNGKFYKSIMSPKGLPVYEYYPQTFSKRTYYVDELFDTTTPEPEWASN